MKGDALYLRHILDAITQIETYVAVGHDDFIAESHWHDATIRQLEIIGEAVKRLSTPARAEHRDVPWRSVAGLRDVLIHDYMGVDLEAVWAVTQAELPTLKRTVAAMLRELDDNLETDS